MLGKLGSICFTEKKTILYEMKLTNIVNGKVTSS